VVSASVHACGARHSPHLLRVGNRNEGHSQKKFFLLAHENSSPALRSRRSRKLFLLLESLRPHHRSLPGTLRCLRRLGFRPADSRTETTTLWQSTPPARAARRITSRKHLRKTVPPVPSAEAKDDWTLISGQPHHHRPHHRWPRQTSQESRRSTLRTHLVDVRLLEGVQAGDRGLQGGESEVQVPLGVVGDGFGSGGLRQDFEGSVRERKTEASRSFHWFVTSPPNPSDGASFLPVSSSLQYSLTLRCSYPSPSEAGAKTKAHGAEKHSATVDSTRNPIRLGKRHPARQRRRNASTKS